MRKDRRLGGVEKRTNRRTAEAEKTMVKVVSGQDLIDAGMLQGKWFRPALDAANKVVSENGSMDEAMAAARTFQPGPTLALRTSGDIDLFEHPR